MLHTECWWWLFMYSKHWSNTKTHAAADQWRPSISGASEWSRSWFFTCCPRSFPGPAVFFAANTVCLWTKF